MYRSSSYGLLSEFSSKSSSSSSLVPTYSSPNLRLTFGVESDDLPSYSPGSYRARKERDRLRFAENAIHLIPLIIVLSVILLWVFSDPDTMVL